MPVLSMEIIIYFRNEMLFHDENGTYWEGHVSNYCDSLQTWSATLQLQNLILVLHLWEALSHNELILNFLQAKNLER